MTKEYDYTCANCNGLVAKPNTMYGWGGSFCDCKEPKKPEPVQTATFMSKEQTNSWEEEYQKVIIPEIRKAIVEYSRFADFNKNASYDAYQTLTTGTSLVSENKTAELQYKLRNFISKTISQEREKWIEEIKKIKIAEDYSGDNEYGEQQFREKVINLLQK